MKKIVLSIILALGFVNASLAETEWQWLVEYIDHTGHACHAKWNIKVKQGEDFENIAKRDVLVTRTCRIESISGHGQFWRNGDKFFFVVEGWNNLNYFDYYYGEIEADTLINAHTASAGHNKELILSGTILPIS